MFWRIWFFVTVFSVYGALGYLLFPGLMSPDALFQYAQMKSGQMSDLHPPIMIHLWRLIDPYFTGAAGLFILQWSLYVTAVWLIATTLYQSYLPRVFIAAPFMAPPMIVVLMGIWKDGLLIGFMLLAVACILKIATRPNLFWVALALACLWMGAALRHNAILSILPLVGCIMYLIPRFHCRWCLLAKTLVLTGIIAASTTYVNRQNVTHVDMLPTVAVWDLAAMSVSTNTMLIPAYARKDPNLSVEKLKELFDPMSNVPLCRFVPGSGRQIYCMEKIPLRAGEALPSDETDSLRHDWLAAIAEHPRAYIMHRMRLTCYLLNLCKALERPSKYRGFITASTQPTTLSEAWYDGPDAETLGIAPTPKPSDIGERIIERLTHWRATTEVLSSWPYLTLLLTMTILAMTYPLQGRRHVISVCIQVSGWLMALPLVIIAPNFQLRYLIWPILCAILSLCLFRIHPRVQAPQKSAAPAPKKLSNRNLKKTAA